MLRKRFVPVVLLALIFGLLLSGCEKTQHLVKAMKLKDLAKDNAGNYKQAIEEFKLFLADNPQTERKPMIEEQIADCYLKWAENEKQLKHWNKGIDLMQKVLDNFPDTDSASTVEDLLPEYLLEYAQQYSNNGDFVNALKVLKRLISHFPASGYAQEGRKLRSKIGIIAFNSGTDIYVMNADGSRLRKVAEMAIDPTISPDGTKIAYIKIRKPKDRKGYLYLANIDGRKAKRLLDKPIASEPNFSPDGTNILITKGDAFQKVDLTGRTINVYFGIKDFDTIGSFNPKGDKVVAFLQHPRGKISRLVVTDDFESYTELTTTENDPIRDAAWSQDNLRIVYVRKAGLYSISPDGEDESEFLASASLENMDFRSVDISPPGNDIIFIGKKDSDPEYKLYAVNFNKDVQEVQYQPTKDGTLPKPSPGRVSWSYGYLRY